MKPLDYSMNTTSEREIFRPRSHGLWSGIIAGFFISILAFWILSTLGVALGGHSLTNISRNNLEAFSVGSAIWLMLAAVVACFLGGYFCSRIASYASWKAGLAEGMVVASAFFLFLTIQSTVGVAFMGSGMSSVAQLASGDSTLMGDRPEFQGLTGNALNGLTLKTEPNVVSNRIAMDLIRGDVQSARNDLAYQSGLSSEDVDARINTLSASINRSLNEIQNKAGKSLAMMGWFTFMTALVGTILCCLGAAMGARQNATSYSRMWAAPRSEVPI